MGLYIAEDATRKFTPASRASIFIMVDMQEFFLKEYPQWRHQVTEAVRQRLRVAIREKRYIVLVEFAGQGRTLDTLLAELQGYDPKRVIRVTKTGADGSEEILAACAELNLAFDVTEVCGIYKNGCLLQTVKSLVDELPHRKFLFDLKASEPVPALKAWTKLFAGGQVLPIGETVG